MSEDHDYIVLDALVANQDAELRSVIGALVEQLDSQYLVVEGDDGELNVLRASHLAWLPYGKALSDLAPYFLPACKLELVKGDGTEWTAEEIDDFAAEHRDEVVMLFRGGQFEQLLVYPPDLGPGGASQGKLVKCRNCYRRVRLLDNRRRCPVCHKPAI